MDYLVLKSELANDPLGLGYSGLSARAKSNLLNVHNRENNNVNTADLALVLIRRDVYSSMMLGTQSKFTIDMMYLMNHGEQFPTLNLNAKYIKDIFDGLEAEQHINATIRGAINALKLAKGHAYSRAGELGLPTVYAKNVKRAEEMV